MTLTYRAILHGDSLEWLGEMPEVQTDHPLRVQATIEEPVPVAEGPARGQAMAALVEHLAARGTLSAIPDPVQWQRELRQERTLPGREA